MTTITTSSTTAASPDVVDAAAAAVKATTTTTNTVAASNINSSLRDLLKFIVSTMSTVAFRLFGRVMDRYTSIVYGKELATSATSLKEISDKDIFGQDVKISSLLGNVILAVNVASNCGLTKVNYQQLPKLVDEYGERGFKVLAFPCNQFGGQEPGTHEEILEFVKKYDPKMSEKLLFFEKGDVNGSQTREIYKFIKPHALNFDGTVDLRWNFQHFLIDDEGNPYKRFAGKNDPFDLRDDIEFLLKKKEGKE